MLHRPASSAAFGLARLKVRLPFLVLWGALAGCTGVGQSPNLVELREATPRHVETGDRLRVGGSGFPEGRAARVVLRGELRRSGEPAVQDVEIIASAELTSPHTLDVAMTPELTRRLCGEPDARHTTFRGDLEVAFAPRTSSGSAVGGVLEGVVLDISPDDPSPTALAALRGEGARFAAFVGASVSRTEQGLVISKVEPQSRASRAGLLDGDVVTELSEVVVRDLSDLVPPPNQSSARVQVQRGTEKLTLELESSGFRYHSANVLGRAVLLVGLVLAPFLFLWSPLGRVLAFLERRVAERLRGARVQPPPRDRRLARAQGLLTGLAHRLPGSFLPYFGLVAASTLFTLLALGKVLIARELDLLLLPLGATGGLFAAAVASGGGGQRWSLRRGLARASSVLVLSAPPIFALLGAAARVDSLAVSKLVRAQGSVPWEWGLFDNPSALLSGAFAIAALVPPIRPARHFAGSPPSVSGRLLDVAEWAHKLVLSGTFCIALLGGWQLPGGSETLTATILGALSLLLKSWLLLGFVAFLRWAVGALDATVSAGAALLWLVTPSVLCVGLSLAWRGWIRHPVLSPVDAELGKVLFAGCLAAAAWLAHRFLHGPRSEGPELGVQSWL